MVERGIKAAEEHFRQFVLPPGAFRTNASGGRVMSGGGSGVGGSGTSLASKLARERMDRKAAAQRAQREQAEAARAAKALIPITFAFEF